MKFNRQFESNGLVQQVVGPTQREGHTLDFLITCTDVTPTANLVEEPSLSDHSFIVAEMALQIDRSQPVVIVVERRSWGNFDINIFSAELAALKLIADPPSDVKLFACYDDTLQTFMGHLSKLPDDNVPRATVSWCNAGCRAVKAETRRPERIDR